MNRRGFLKLLSAAVGILAIGEIPKGREFISLSGPHFGLDESAIIARELEYIRKKVPLLFDRDDVFYRSLEGYSSEFNVEKKGSLWVPIEFK